MSSNPLIPSDHDDLQATRADAAVELIRRKVAGAYQDEPSATEELAEVKTARSLSKHQQYMKELSSSGKSLAEIQTAWHHYYTTLSDGEKHEVWQEFYAANQNTPYQKLFQKQHASKERTLSHAPEPALPAEQPPAASPLVSLAPDSEGRPVFVADHAAYAAEVAHTSVNKTAAHAIKERVIHRVSAGGKLTIKHHLQSLLFGLATGAIVLAILLFSFFNQYIIAPFIQPSRNVSATPIILGDAQDIAAGPPQVIIPKINVQIPLDFTVQTNDEATIENALENGVVHYPSTVKPGENGNTAFFGHSSNNIFNPGKYKFAFVLLHTLTTGDIFYITYNGQAYAYQVFASEVVPPSQVSVLNDTKGKTATAVLITCDPPGTSRNRLVVWGEQISPAVGANTATAPAPVAATAPKQLADNGPSLWTRMVRGVQYWR